MRFEPGEVLLAEITFPHQNPKLRPVFVISKHSSASHDPSNRVFICVPITSVDSSGPFTFKVGEGDIIPPLLKQSYVLSNYIFTVSKDDVRKKIGTASQGFCQRVIGAVKQDVI